MIEETRNRVLRALHGEARAAALRECQRVEYESRTVLVRAGESASGVQFPETMVISALATYRDGSTIEMANIGREACTGLGDVLNQSRQLVTYEVQVGGTALEMPASAFAALRGSYPEFDRVMVSAVQAIVYQIMVSGACNGAHDAKQRLARWLLTMADRADGDTLHLTQEFLAEMLAVRRATVSEAAIDLQSAGLIEYSRGEITITNRPGLRRESCECYDLVRNVSDSLLPEREG